MTERERIVEAMAQAAKAEMARWVNVAETEGPLDVWAAALDAALPLVLPEEPSEQVVQAIYDGFNGYDKAHGAFAARRKELSA